MIVRERNEEFVMIEQHHHASISGELFTCLKNHLAPEPAWKEAIKFAIYNHDCGWIPFDQTPFWNDEKNAPFSFTNYPTAPKTVLYETGITKVAQKSLYAGLLCSKHYSLFLEKHSEALAKQFLENERVRQEKIKDKIQTFDEEKFLSHYEILQFFDNLSLYICLNEPGVKKENEHPFFKKGIPLPSSFSKQSLYVYWSSNRDIMLDQALFTSDITVSLKQKVIAKQDIFKKGLQKSYKEAPTETILITIKAKD